MKEVPPSRLTLSQHVELLEWIEVTTDLDIDLNRVQNVHIWALVALAALAGKAGFETRTNRYYTDQNNEPSRFAHAVGYDPLVGGKAPSAAQEEGRTVRLRRVRRFEEIERVASEISGLLLNQVDAEDTRRTLYYILVEFLRNAVQHGVDHSGAIVGAQLMDKTREYEDRPMIQIAVGDAGIGVMASLRATYPEIENAHQAIVMAQQPWVSSQFHRGLRGGPTNAGLGLYFISEMAKRTAGKFLIASRGGSLLLQGDATYQQHHHIVDERPGYPGTVVVFELPVGEIEDYDGLISVIHDLAKERIPRRVGVRWLRFEPAPRVGSLRIGVRIGAEDTAHAQRLVKEHLLPRISRGESIEFDFSGLRVCTQSYLHALMFSALQAAHAAGVQIYVTHANPAVVSSLDFLESYALPV
jgi:hypothetical protein